MTRAKKLLLVFAALAVLTQIPFAYRRYRLGQLNSRIQMLNTEHRITAPDQSWTEYQGVIARPFVSRRAQLGLLPGHHCSSADKQT